ncbi:MAG UNVERIFIED_CONTAM: hypothetical protein LVR18_31330 [Planctomycetaceae bacterium]
MLVCNFLPTAYSVLDLLELLLVVMECLHDFGWYDRGFTIFSVVENACD